MSKLKAAVAIAATILPMPTLAQTSAEYAVMGKQSWAELQCAALAEFAGDTHEYDRLLPLGVAKQRTFIEAQDANKVEQQDYSREMPDSYLMALAGTALIGDVSPDFDIGVLWAAARDARACHSLRPEKQSCPGSPKGGGCCQGRLLKQKL